MHCAKVASVMKKEGADKTCILAIPGLGPHLPHARLAGPGGCSWPAGLQGGCPCPSIASWHAAFCRSSWQWASLGQHLTPVSYQLLAAAPAPAAPDCTHCCCQGLCPNLSLWSMKCMKSSMDDSKVSITQRRKPLTIAGPTRPQSLRTAQRQHLSWP